MRNVIAIGMITLSFACGGMATGEYPDYGASDAGADFGEAEQALTSQTSSTTEQGTRYVGVMLESVPFNGLTYGVARGLQDGLTWFVPPYRSMTVRVTQGSCSTVQWNRFEPRAKEAILEIHNALKAYGWSITYASNGTHTMHCFDLNQSPLGANNIRSFVRTQCNTDYANNVDDQGLSGVATRYTNCTIQVDSAAVLLAGDSTSKENRIYRHACLHGLEQLVGVGEEAGDNGTVSKSVIAPSTDLALFTPGQLCRTRYYQGAADSSPTVYGLKTDKGCPNN